MHCTKDQASSKGFYVSFIVFHAPFNKASSQGFDVMILLRLLYWFFLITMTRRSQVLMYSYKQTIQQYFRTPNTCLLAWFLYQGTIRQLCLQVHQRPECLTVTSHQGPAAWKPVQLSVAWPQIWLDARSLGHRRIYIFLTVAWFKARFSVNGKIQQLSDNTHTKSSILQPGLWFMEYCYIVLQ